MGGKFYVYEHWRPDTGEIFYIGKGHGRRAFDMRRGRNRWHRFIVQKVNNLSLSVEIRVVHTDLDETEAFAREIELIAHWREKGAKLCNMSDGGEGPPGYKHTEWWKQATRLRNLGRKMPPDAVAKTAAFNKGKRWALGSKRPRAAIEATAAAHRGTKRSQEVVERLRQIRLAHPTFKGKTHTPEWREMMRASQVGIPKSEETKARMRKPKSEAHKQKLRAINLGKIHSDETRRKLAEMARLQWARRRSNVAAEE
jgi:hypothetical protein